MVIAYAGKERCDIANYLQKAATLLYRTVLIVDNSLTGDLYESIAHGEGDGKAWENGAIVRNRIPDAATLSQYDFTLIYLGMNQYVKLDPFVKIDHLYLGASANTIEVKALKKVLMESAVSAPVSLVIEDVVMKKFTPQTIVTELGMTKLPAIYPLPLSVEDHRAYEFMVNEKFVSLKNASSDMKSLIHIILTNDFGQDEKSAKRLERRL